MINIYTDIEKLYKYIEERIAILTDARDNEFRSDFDIGKAQYGITQLEIIKSKIEQQGEPIMTGTTELAKERLALWEGMLKMQDRIDKINRLVNKNAYVAAKHRGKISHSNMDKDQQAKCPKCKTPLYCPCKACTEREPKGLRYQDHYHWKHGEVICCPVCGYEDGCDMWG